MKYTIIDEVGINIFCETFNEKEIAIKEAKREWENLDKYDKSRRNAFYVLANESGEYGDGDIIFTIK